MLILKKVVSETFCDVWKHCEMDFLRFLRWLGYIQPQTPPFNLHDAKRPDTKSFHARIITDYAKFCLYQSQSWNGSQNCQNLLVLCAWLCLLSTLAAPKTLQTAPPPLWSFQTRALTKFPKEPRVGTPEANRPCKCSRTPTEESWVYLKCLVLSIIFFNPFWQKRSPQV